MKRRHEGFTIDDLPEHLRWNRRPGEYGSPEERAWWDVRVEWARAHGLGKLDLLRHDRDERKRVSGGAS